MAHAVDTPHTSWCILSAIRKMSIDLPSSICKTEHDHLTWAHSASISHIDMPDLLHLNEIVQPRMAIFGWTHFAALCFWLNLGARFAFHLYINIYIYMDWSSETKPSYLFIYYIHMYIINFYSLHGLWFLFSGSFHFSCLHDQKGIYSIYIWFFNFIWCTFYFLFFFVWPTRIAQIR